MEWLCLRLHNLNDWFRLFYSRFFIFSCQHFFDWIPSFIKNCKYFSCWLYFRKLHKIGLIHETLAILCDSFIIPSFYKLLHWIELKGYYEIRILWKVYFLIIIFCSYYLVKDPVIWSFKTFSTKSIMFFLSQGCRKCLFKVFGSKTLGAFFPVFWKAEGQKAALSPQAVLFCTLNQTFINNTKERSCQKQFQSLQCWDTERATCKAPRFIHVALQETFSL